MSFLCIRKGFRDKVGRLKGGRIKGGREEGEREEELAFPPSSFPPSSFNCSLRRISCGFDMIVKLIQLFVPPYDTGKRVCPPLSGSCFVKICLIIQFF